MREFNLGLALSGDKVITRDGREVTQVHSFDAQDTEFNVYGVVDDGVESWTNSGSYHDINELSGADLFMVAKSLGGFINVYNDLSNPFSLHATKIDANTTDNMVSVHRVALIDLSQFEEGHGL